jgi:hypothetical protein
MKSRQISFAFRQESSHYCFEFLAGRKSMPGGYDRRSSLQLSSREELIKYLEAAVPRIEAEDATAGFLLRIVLETLRAIVRPDQRKTGS